MENSVPHNHEDHIAGKGQNSLQHFNLVHKFIPMPQAMKIPAAKAADKEWEKLEKISAWNLTKVKSMKQVIDEARMSGATVHFAPLMDVCHLKNAELEVEHQKYKGRKRRLRVSHSIYCTRIFSISNDSRQDHGYHLQVATTTTPPFCDNNNNSNNKQQQPFLQQQQQQHLFYNSNNKQQHLFHNSNNTFCIFLVL